MYAPPLFFLPDITACGVKEQKFHSIHEKKRLKKTEQNSTEKRRENDTGRKKRRKPNPPQKEKMQQNPTSLQDIFTQQ